MISDEVRNQIKLVKEMIAEDPEYTVYIINTAINRAAALALKSEAYRVKFDGELIEIQSIDLGQVLR